ncbi:cytochrome P450 2U1-like [Paramacrobiotus metropolitanus]|uniref:cytochrome P450 2U1-like n=1 Tax=Paramacrobiotus metropolitanus TaxID=2943436 RepID=UPI002445F488|nr:cytochrome P450 2U1-like [Paramacrobiotus metropolitanus]
MDVVIAASVLAVCALMIMAAARVVRRSSLKSKKTLPPSPFSLPFLGSLPFVDPAGLHLTLRKWALKYGNIFSCYLGPKVYIVLNDFRLVKQILHASCEVFGGRPNFFLTQMSLKKDEPFSKGIVLNEGEAWKVHRRFAQKVFRDFGVGTNVFEQVINEEAVALCNDFEQECGKPFDNTWLIKKAVGNVIAYILFGTRFSHEDENFRHTVKFIDQTIEENMASSALLNFFPWLRYIPPFSRQYQSLRKELEHFRQRKAMLIKGRGELPVHDASVQNYVDAFLSHMETTKDPYFTDFQMRQCVGEIFAAGFATTASTIRWILLYIAIHRDIQDAIHAELDKHVGLTRQLQWSDRSSLTFLEATILESQRLATVVPFLIPRRTLQNTTIGEYYIPADTVLLPNAWYIHHDPQLFPEPDKFCPSRFIGPDGHVKIPEGFLPFGTGIRVCPGENLAKMELLLFVGTLLQNFDVSLPAGVVPDLSPSTGSTYDAKPYQIVISKRTICPEQNQPE